MRIIIKYNLKLSKWIIFINDKVLFDIFINRNIVNNYSIFFKSYNALLKVLRQFGLKKPLKNKKEY